MTVQTSQIPMSSYSSNKKSIILFILIQSISQAKTNLLRSERNSDQPFEERIKKIKNKTLNQTIKNKPEGLAYTPQLVAQCLDPLLQCGGYPIPLIRPAPRQSRAEAMVSGRSCFTLLPLKPSTLPYSPSILCWRNLTQWTDRGGHCTTKQHYKHVREHAELLYNTTMPFMRGISITLENIRG